MLMQFLERWKAAPIVALSMMGMFIAGCHSDAPIEARGDQYQAPWLMMGSQELRRDTVVGTPTQYVDEAGLLHVSVPVRNATDLQLYVDSFITFFAPSGAEINTVHKTLTIPSRGQVSLTASSTAPAGGPMPFRVELRYPRIQ